jgi:diguanylate cyclase (GGDEF)-like protein
MRASILITFWEFSGSVSTLIAYKIDALALLSQHPIGISIPQASITTIADKTDNTMTSPIPENETQRLEVLRSYDILNTPPEIDFDALTRIAVHAFDTPAAVIGLMDADRLWFKSRLGLDEPQLDRQIAFCAYAIMEPEKTLIVEDLKSDPRFEDNPLVTQPPNLRFYAGAPIVARSGHALGTIAIADIKPRSFSNEQSGVLRDLSTLVMTALESRRRAMQLARLAMTDYLTGLANRAEFDRTLEAEMAHATRTAETFSVLYLDLDGFKLVNDSFGHAAGDEVLCEVARRLSQQVRAEDELARFGGDEFGVILRDASQDSAHKLAERIAEAVSEPIMLSSGAMTAVGVSAGIATYADAIDTATALLAEADRDLYQAKHLKGIR